VIRSQVAFVGQVTRRKGIFDFLDAVAAFAELAGPLGLAGALEFSIHNPWGDPETERMVRGRIAAMPNVSYEGPFAPATRGKVFGKVDLVLLPAIGENYPFLMEMIVQKWFSRGLSDRCLLMHRANH
jgi:hypothetical protein